MNRAVLSAKISEIGPLRHTPAGLPAFDLLLEHESQVIEAGQPRQVKAKAKAVAFGTVAERIAKQPLGSQWTFSGFLATPGTGNRLVLHIQDFQ